MLAPSFFNIGEHQCCRILLIASVLSTPPAAAQAIQIAPEQKRQQALEHYRAGQTLLVPRKSGTMRLQS